MLTGGEHSFEIWQMLPGQIWQIWQMFPGRLQSTLFNSSIALCLAITGRYKFTYPTYFLRQPFNLLSQPLADAHERHQIQPIHLLLYPWRKILSWIFQSPWFCSDIPHVMRIFHSSWPFHLNPIDQCEAWIKVQWKQNNEQRMNKSEYLTIRWNHPLMKF